MWTQIFADTLQLPMEIPDGTEIGARGAAMSAGIGVGAYRDRNPIREDFKWVFLWESIWDRPPLKRSPMIQPGKLLLPTAFRPK